jgi:hypothetical protein
MQMLQLPGKGSTSMSSARDAGKLKALKPLAGGKLSATTGSKGDLGCIPNGMPAFLIQPFLLIIDSSLL